MENAPVTNIIAWKFHNPEDYIRFGKWMMEVFFPIYMKSPYISGINRYQIIKENPDYCPYISTYHFSNFKAFINHWKSPEAVLIGNDTVTTWGNKRDVIWNYAYQRERSVHIPAFADVFSKDLKASDAPSIHFEAFDLPREKEGDYYSWFTDIGDEVFISRIMKRAGVIGYDHLQFLNISFSYLELEQQSPKDRLGPAYVSIFYFDSVQHCLDFTKSRELAAFRTGLSSYLPEGLKLKWNVDYQLIGSWTNEKASSSV